MAGTRIKVVADISATAAETTINSANATAAQAQAWLNAFEAVMIAAGFVRTSDTGQYASVAATITSTANLGYRVYALSDEYSATSPLIVKATFAGRSRGSTDYRLRCAQIKVGFATDGAGNFVGNTAIAHTMSANSTSNKGGVTWQGVTKTFAWRKDYVTLVAVQPSSYKFTCTDTGGTYTSYTAELFFAVARLQDSAGNVDTSGFMVYGSNPAVLSTANGYQSETYSFLNAFRLTASSVLDLSGSSATLQHPTASYKLDSNNLPVLIGAMYGRTVDDYSYSLGGIYFGQNNSLYTMPALVTASGPSGDAPVYLIGTCFHINDPGRYYDAAKANAIGYSSFYSIYIGHQMINTDAFIALDWS